MNTRAQLVTCDRPGCGRRFRAELVEIPDELGGVTQQFTCPRCDHAYPVCHITARGLELRPRIQAAAAAGDDQLRRRLVEDLQTEITRLTTRGGSR